MTQSRPALEDLAQHADFVERHIGPDSTQQKAMLTALGFDSIDALIKKVVPGAILEKQPLAFGSPRSEAETLASLRQIASKNQIFKSHIGMGVLQLPYPDRDSAQFVGKSSLVHRLNAVSTRNFARAAGGIIEFPDHGHGSHRHGNR
jgi:hypothetical protein